MRKLFCSSRFCFWCETCLLLRKQAPRLCVFLLIFAGIYLYKFYLIWAAVSNGFGAHFQAAKEVVQEAGGGGLEHLLEHLVGGGKLGSEGKLGGGWRRGVEVETAVHQQTGAANQGFTLPLQKSGGCHGLPGEQERNVNPAAAAAPEKLQLELGVRWQRGPASEERGTAADDVGDGEGGPGRGCTR